MDESEFVRVAAKSGGYHLCNDGQRRINPRDGSELFAALSADAGQQSEEAVNLRAGDA